MLRLSTGLRNKMLGGAGGGDFQGLMAGGIMKLFTGVQPASADSVETGILLAEITLSGGNFTAGADGASTNGLRFDDPVAGVLSKAAAEAWQGVGLADGSVGWFRFYASEEETGASATADRFDGSVGASGAQLIMTNTTIASLAPVVVSTFKVTLPSS